MVNFIYFFFCLVVLIKCNCGLCPTMSSLKMGNLKVDNSNKRITVLL